MSEQENAQEGAGAPNKKSALLPIVLLACAVAGTATGVFGVAPMVLGNPGAAGEQAEAPKPRGGGGHGGGAAGPPIYLVENVVLNPSGSSGTRFLMVTAAFELTSDDAVEEMGGRDPEIRDLVNRKLAARTVDQLTDLTNREAIREDLRNALNEVLHMGTVEKVYLPQFVIQ